MTERYTMNRKEHRARFTWSPEQLRLGLPAFEETVDPAWLSGSSEEGWSLRCRFPKRPSDQGNPSEGYVSFAMDDAPHDQLRPGSSLRLYERATQRHASVDIID